MSTHPLGIAAQIEPGVANALSATLHDRITIAGGRVQQSNFHNHPLLRLVQKSKQNGGKTLDQLLHHVAEDALVLGAWNPGEGRERPPMSHPEIVRHTREWIEGRGDPKSAIAFVGHAACELCLPDYS